MKKLVTPLFGLLFMSINQTADAQTLTRFYLQDFGKASFYNPSNLFTNNYAKQSGSNSQYSYNAIFNAGTASGVTSAKLVTDPPSSFTSYGLVSPQTQPNDGNLSIVQRVGPTPNNGATFSSTGYGSSFWDHTTGGDGTGNTGSTTNPTPDGFFLSVNADNTHTGVSGGSYFELPLQILNIPGATYSASLWWRDIDGTSSYDVNPAPAFVGVDVNTGPKGTGTSLARITNPASSLSPSATTADKQSKAPRSTVSMSWQRLVLPNFELSQSFKGNILYFNVYNSDPGFKNGNGNDLGIDDIELSLQTISSISGKIYNDGTATGISTTFFDGSASPLFVSLLDANNKVVQSVAVGSDGSYAFATNQSNEQFIPYALGNIGLKIVLSSSNLPVGTSNVDTQATLVGIVTTGTNTPGDNTFVPNQTNRGIALQSTNTNNIDGANTYVNFKPIATSTTNTLNKQPQVGDKISIILTGTDREDNATDITATAGGTTVTIVSAPTNGHLLYDDIPVVQGQTINGFDPSKLKLNLTGKGYRNTSFSYTFTDKGGATSSVATYTLVLPFVLPVKLSSFTAVIQNGYPYLQWTTSTEVNNAGFQIQRSTDAQIWTTIGYKRSDSQNGNSSSSLTYDYLDTNPLVGTYYYRLVQTDYDGNTNLSQIVSLTRTIGQVSLNIYPNPAGDYIDVSNGTIGSTLRIVGMDGKVHYTTTISNSPQRISLSGYAAGLYLVQVYVQNGKVDTLKFVKK